VVFHRAAKDPQKKQKQKTPDEFALFSRLAVSFFRCFSELDGASTSAPLGQQVFFP